MPDSPPEDAPRWVIAGSSGHEDVCSADELPKVTALYEAAGDPFTVTAY